MFQSQWPRPFVSVFLCALLLAAPVQGETPDRTVTETALGQMLNYTQANDYTAWAGYFAEDAVFANAALPEPLVGREAIAALAAGWPELEVVIEWQVIEGDRAAIGWKERRLLDGGRWSGWYRGMSTFKFNSEGKVQAYEGAFNLPDIQAALQ